MKTVALIDGDIVAYKAASTAEVSIEWSPGEWTTHAHEEPARAAIDDQIKSLTEAVDADTAVVAVSDTTNFRASLYGDYKANRKNVRRPIILAALKAYLVETHNAYSRPNLEADDILGILATHATLVRADKRVIVSIDKDFKGVPCFLYNPGHPKDGVVHVTKQQADRWHLIQTLTGDTTDNYPGCPGIGPVKASVLVDAALYSADPWSVIVEAFAKAGLTADDALLQARLARILRADEYNFKAKRPILWEPAKLTEKSTPAVTKKPAAQKTR